MTCPLPSKCQTKNLNFRQKAKLRVIVADDLEIAVWHFFRPRARSSPGAAGE